MPVDHNLLAMEEHNKSNAEEGTSAATEELSPEEQKKARAYIKRQ